MPHDVKSVIDAIVTKLKADLSVPVYRNRSRPVDVAPAVAIRMGSDDDTDEDGFSYSLRRLTVYIDLYVLSDDDDDLDGLLLDLRSEVESALPQTTPLPGSPIQYFEPISQQDPDFNSEAEESAASMRLVYPAIYVTRN